MEDIVSFYSLNDIPETIKIDRKEKSLPPVLEYQLENDNFQVGRIDVYGNGFCGYYAIQLLDYMVTGKSPRTLCNLDAVRKTQIYASIEDEKMSDELANAKTHYLEYIELGAILSYILPDLNIGVIVQTDEKRTGKRRKRTYPVRTVNYKEGKPWAFFLLSRNARHYELLTIVENKLHRAVFSEKEAEYIFAFCFDEFPKMPVEALDQMMFLNASDFVYFGK